MNFNKACKLAGMMCICGAVTVMAPQTVKAAEPAAAEADTASEAGVADINMVAQVDAGNVTIYADQNESSAVLAQAVAGSSYDVLGGGPGWVKVSVNGQEGYIQNGDEITVEKAAKQAEQAAVSKRQQVVDYALQFVGGRYVYGGSDPHTGTDCSGFTRYVMQHAAGVGMNRSSGSQAVQGRSVSADEIQPGDLVFYSSGSRINHVALYIGNGQIVHASTERTGIKISNWTYRSPVKIVSVLG